jgi:hypothetical protein
LQQKEARSAAKRCEPFPGLSHLFARGSVACGSQARGEVGRWLPTEPFQAVAYGVDDMTLGFDMEGSKSVALLNDAPGVQQRRGKMLGDALSWGKWGHLLGRSVAHWKADTKRLYVQAKLAPAGELCRPADVSREIEHLVLRMAALGIMSWEPPWVTRVDVAVDARCKPEVGKLLLDGLEAAVHRTVGGRVVLGHRARRSTSSGAAARRSWLAPTAGT